LLDARADEVVFTSGATEANNIAIFGLAGATPGHIVATPIEHPCVTEPLKQLASRGFAVDSVSVDRDGVASAADFQRRIRSDTRLAACMMVNHETGAIQPSLKLSVPLHIDATQAVGKLRVSFRQSNATTMSLSAHKFGGPKGVGILLVQHGVKFSPIAYGGHQQQGRRPGTECPALAVGLATALSLAIERLDVHYERVSTLKAGFLRVLQAASPIVVNGSLAGSPYAINVSFPGCRAELLLMKLDLNGVACSTGSACSSGSLLPSPILSAMGVPDDVLRSAMRFSMSPYQTIDDIERAATIVVRCVHELRQSGVS
jgi:cysteine desulfurase